MFVQDDVSKASSLAKVQKNPGTTSLAFDDIVIYKWSSNKNGGLAVATFPEVSCCPTLNRTPALLGKDGCASWQHWGCQSQDSNQGIKRWKNEKCWLGPNDERSCGWKTSKLYTNQVEGNRQYQFILKEAELGSLHAHLDTMNWNFHVRYPDIWRSYSCCRFQGA